MSYKGKRLEQTCSLKTEMPANRLEFRCRHSSHFRDHTSDLALLFHGYIYIYICLIRVLLPLHWSIPKVFLCHSNSVTLSNSGYLDFVSPMLKFLKVTHFGFPPKERDLTRNFLTPSCQITARISPKQNFSIFSIPHGLHMQSTCCDMTN